MTDQTPSIEDVLDAVVYYGRQCEDAVVSFHSATPDLEEVRTALAARDREVAAKALRDAAKEWRAGAWAGAERHADRGRDRFAAAQYAGNWLIDRARRIETGEEP